METKPFKPSGLLLILLAGAVAVSGGVVGVLAEGREFDVEPFGILFMAATSLVFFCVFLLPITLGVLFLIRRRNLPPWLRALLVTAPVLVLALPYLVGGLIRPMSVEKTFEKRMRHALPAGATGLRSWYFHGIGERHYMFSFQTTPDATDDLVKFTACDIIEHPAMLDAELGVHYELPINGVAVPKGWPRPKTWEGLQVYRSDQIKDYCYILTDASKTKVFVMVGDT
jgi:hypothetical protein